MTIWLVLKGGHDVGDYPTAAFTAEPAAIRELERQLRAERQLLADAGAEDVPHGYWITSIEVDAPSVPQP